MINTYFSLFILWVLATGFLATMLIFASILGPKHRSEIKDAPFECGTVGTGDAQGRFGVKYYMVAMLFILFDIEIVFLYPWAVNAIQLGWYGYFVMLSFLAVLLLGLVYVWRRGALDWS